MDRVRLAIMGCDGGGAEHALRTAEQTGLSEPKIRFLRAMHLIAESEPEKAHLHLHVIANMVNIDGKSIRDNWIALKGKKLSQKLTDEYKLIPALRKDLTASRRSFLASKTVPMFP